MSFAIRTVLCFVLLLWGVLGPASAKRVALVIGNSSYQSVDKLVNPANDAIAIAKSLKRLGFTSVVHKSDLDYREFRRTLSEFSRLADDADVAIIYYAGHGIEVSKRNYLIPVDAQLRDARDIDLEALPLDVMLNTLEGARSLRLVVLDACRDNPFRARMTRSGGRRSVGRGLSRVNAATNTLVAYAAKEGTTADDGDQGHSPYAAALLQHIETPGLEINFLFRRVRDSVLSSTGGRQEPFVYGSLSSQSIYLKPSKKASEGPHTKSDGAVGKPTANKENTLDAASRAWETVKNTKSLGMLDAFIKRFPDSVYADFAKLRKIELQKQARLERTKANNDLTTKARLSEQAARKTYLRGLYAFERKDYGEALQLFRQAVEKNNPSAMFYLGFFYEKGFGIRQNYAQAVRWYRESANRNNAYGLHNLALLYNSGLGVPKMPGEASSLISLALGLGNEFVLKEMLENNLHWGKPFRVALQRILRQEGVYDGPLDGSFGPATKRAIKQFAEKRN